MNKIIFRYTGIINHDDPMKGIHVQVYDSEPRKDGVHIAASSVFNASMLKKLSKRNIEDLFANLVGAIEACNKAIEIRQSEKL